jgi:hypothetical protein
LKFALNKVATHMPLASKARRQVRRNGIWHTRFKREREGVEAGAKAGTGHFSMLNARKGRNNSSDGSCLAASVAVANAAAFDTSVCRWNTDL